MSDTPSTERKGTRMECTPLVCNWSELWLLHVNGQESQLIRDELVRLHAAIGAAIGLAPEPAEKDSRHFADILRGYGEIKLIADGDGPADNLFIEAWGAHVRVRRESGATEPNYYGLFIAARYYGYGLSAGVVNGKREAYRELRQLIGAKEET